MSETNEAALLTPCELAVLRLSAQGLTSHKIGYTLNVSKRTVDFHRNSIFSKSGTSGIVEAMAFYGEGFKIRPEFSVPKVAKRGRKAGASR